LFTVIFTTSTSLIVTPLNPSTSYDFFIQGVNALGVYSNFNAFALTVVTSAGNPKQVPSIDITNFQCAQFIANSTGRKDISCTWNAPKPPSTLRVVEIETKCRCTSLQRQPVFIRKDLAPAATSSIYIVNRDVATCVIWVRAIYNRAGVTGGRHLYGNRQQTIVILN